MNAGCNLITRLVLTKTDENKLDFMTDCMTWIKRLERKSNVKQAFLLMRCKCHFSGYCAK